MLAYVLIGAVVGVVVGHLIPPGGIFWLVIGGVGGYFVKYYTDRRY